MDQDFDGAVNLSNCSVKDACLWLLSKLEVSKHMNLPYALPYCNYVMSWHEAIPLTAIVMAQSPYPNPIYPEVAAAMSYDPIKCKEVMKMNAPPTVQVLSNDLKIHANMDKDDATHMIMNGWALASKGVLLVNSSVFKSYGTGEAYTECINQVNVLNKLLVESEKFGERTVDIIAYGAGQAMATELTKTFKSSIIKLTKFTSSHPASLSYRMKDLSSPECHMDSPSTSRVLAKHFSNHVAFVYTMAKQSAAEAKAKRQLDTIRSLGEQLVPLKQVSEELFPMMKNLLKSLEEDDVENFRMTLQQIIHTGDTFTFRLGTTSAALSQTQASVGGTSTTVSKPGPNLATTSPSATSLSQHVGGEFKAANPMAPRRVSITRRNKPPSTDVPSTTDTTVNVSSVASVISDFSNTTSTNIAPQPAPQQALPPARRAFKIRRKSEPVTRASTDDTATVVESPTSEATTPKASSFNDEEDDKTTSSLGARFRKLPTIQEYSQSGNTGKTEEKSDPNPEWILTKEVLHQLACVEAVVQSHGGEVADEEDALELLEAIQSDIASKTAYNAVTRRLAESIKTDLDTIPKFDFSKWVMDAKKHSATFDQCKEEFGF